MQAVLQLLGVIVLLAAVAPVAMAGGQMIAAFMMRKNILPWVGITLLSMVVLIAGGLLAIRVVMPWLAGIFSDLLAPLVSALVLLAPPWAAWLLGKRWIDQKVAA
ncbi:MAG: hypothetical protein HC858_01350 [Brachymonas sp.]|nr:hypothetical protein [Brachymonas sp.]